MNTLTQPQTGAVGSVHRAQISQLITSVVITTGEPRPLIWQRIYTRLETAFGIRIRQLPRHQGECLLTVAEKNGLMNQVYSLAYSEHMALANHRRKLAFSSFQLQSQAHCLLNSSAQ